MTSIDSLRVLEQPLTLEQIKAFGQETEIRVNGVVAIPIDTIIENNFETFLDTVSDLLIGHVILQDILYEMVGCDLKKDTVLFNVEGTVNLEDW